MKSISILLEEVAQFAEQIEAVVDVLEKHYGEGAVDDTHAVALEIALLLDGQDR